ncbi:MAG: Gfo/Idh/MocA family protein, partial [Thermomicrobiales bacterium]
YMTVQNVIRLGVIGTGLAVEKLHWPALKRLSEKFQITAYSNHTRPKADHFADYSQTATDGFSEDYQDLLVRDDVDAVLISLPITDLLQATVDALAAGKHVICEKPAGANEQEGRAFVKLVSNHPKLKVLIAENWFYRDDLRFARSLLDDGTIGSIHLVSWRLVSQLIPRAGEFSSTPWRHDAGYDGGPHLDGGVHHTAQIRFLCGDINRLHGETQNSNSTHSGPSDLALNFRMVSGAIGDYTASYPEIPVSGESNEMRLYGTKGQMTIGRHGINVARSDGTNETWHVQQQDGGYYNELLNFYDAVVYDTPIVGTVVQSFRNMEIVLKGLESARKGQVISLSELPAPLSANAVPLWKPRGATDLFEGLNVTITKEST